MFRFLCSALSAVLAYLAIACPTTVSAGTFDRLSSSVRSSSSANATDSAVDYASLYVSYLRSQDSGSAANFVADPKSFIEKFEVFKANAQFIDRFNTAAHRDVPATHELRSSGSSSSTEPDTDYDPEFDLTYQMALNEFATMSAEQFQRQYASGFRSAVHSSQLAARTGDDWDYLDDSSKDSNTNSTDSTDPPVVDDHEVFADSTFFKNLTVATSVDWRERKAVTTVKQQGSCGSVSINRLNIHLLLVSSAVHLTVISLLMVVLFQCWSFSVTGAIEGAHAIQTGELIDLSQQQMMDCSSSYGNQGCNGGTMVETFQYVVENKGICAAQEYNYTGKEGTCKKDCNKVAAITSYKSVAPGDELALLKAVNVGPVSVAIQADASSLQFYSSGIYQDPKCGRDLNHAVLLVGYGSEVRKTKSGESKTIDYWVVKNSVRQNTIRINHSQSLPLQNS